MPLCDKSLDKRKSVFTSLPVKQIIVIFSTNETVAEYECLCEINLSKYMHNLNTADPLEYNFVIHPCLSMFCAQEGFPYTVWSITIGDSFVCMHVFWMF